MTHFGGAAMILSVRKGQSIMSTKEMSAVALVCCVLMILNGCNRYVVAGAAVGAGVLYGSYKYQQGNLKRNYGAPVPLVWEATLLALDQMNIKPDDKNQDASGGIIKTKLNENIS
jgi:hypothetical protein